MDTRKVTVVAVVLVMAAVAIGAGYAYTATTSNTENTAATVYYKIGQYAEDGDSNPIISETAVDYKQKFTTGINYNTENDAGEITYTLNGTTITAPDPDITVSTIGNTKLVAFDQNGAITTPGVANMTHAKLKVEITSPSSAHTVNSNFTLVAKLGSNFLSGDAPNHETATQNLVGYTVLEQDGEVYSGYLYVPIADLSAGFEVFLGAYFSGNDPTNIKDTSMAYGAEATDPTVDGDNDGNLLYNATVKFSIDSTAWIAEA